MYARVPDEEGPTRAFLYNDAIYYTHIGETNPVKVVRPRRDLLPVEHSYATTGLWHFGLQDNKILTSVTVHSAPLPDDWSIIIDYQADNDGNWRRIGTFNTEGSTGETFILDPGVARKFRQVQIRITF